MARMVIAAMLLQAAQGLLAPTRHLSRAPALHATNADWRSKCDSDGVVSYYDYGLRVGGAAAPAAAPAADGFEVTMSGLKFKDEVRFFSLENFRASLHAIDVRRVCRQPRASDTNAHRRRHRRDDAAMPTAPQQRRSSARARARKRATSLRSNIPDGWPRQISSSILVEIATCPSPSRSATAT